MHEMDRRELLMLGSAAGAVAVGGLGAGGRVAAEVATGSVLLYGDGLGYGAGELAALLSELSLDGQTMPDNYSIGGSVEQLESEMARRLGKERAVFFPTGTLANMIAVRALVGERGGRCLVQEESHIYNDAGDGCQRLCGVSLVGLGPNESTFSFESVEREVEWAASGRVKTPIRALSIESPVRRLWGQVFDFDEMKAIASYAREREIGLHMDGARMFLAQPYTGISPARYAGLFDTVYVSLWKYFNAPSGAILAGPAELLDGMFHERRRFGGSLPAAWPFAAVAAFHLDGFEKRFAAAAAAGEEVLATLADHRGFEVERVTGGTNVAKLIVRTEDSGSYRDRLAQAGIHLSEPLPDGAGFKIQVNETWLRLEPGEICARMEEALS